MKKYKYSEILNYEEKIKKLYFDLGLGFSPLNRISKYFSYLKEVERTRSLSKQSFNQILEKNKAKFYFSQFYALEICNIIDAIENSHQDRNLIKEKLFDLAKGTYLLSEETVNNSKARDTTFELVLFSFLYARGLDVNLCYPNPDIRFSTSNFTYNIECKRPSSQKSLEKNIKIAVKQLQKINNGKDIPTIALSLEQVLLGDLAKKIDPLNKHDLILDSRTGQSALSFLDATLSKFLQANIPMIIKVCGDYPCLILYHLSCLAGLKQDFIMANATFITGNVYNFESDLTQKILADLRTNIKGSEQL